MSPCRGGEIIFTKGDRFSLEFLRGKNFGKDWQPVAQESTVSEAAPEIKEDSFWDRVHAIETSFRAGLEQDDPDKTTNALLELDRTIWKAKQDLENEEFISQAREVLRDLIVLFGMELESSPKDKTEWFAPLIGELLDLRERFRQNRQWQEADEVRDSLLRADILVEDTEDGPRWRLKS